MSILIESSRIGVTSTRLVRTRSMKAFTSRSVAATTGAISSQVERSRLEVVTGDAEVDKRPSDEN